MWKNFSFLSVFFMLAWILQDIATTHSALGQPDVDTAKSKLQQERAQLLSKFAGLNKPGNEKAAIPEAEKLLILDEQLFGKNHQAYLTTLRLVANLRQKIGDFEKADKLMREAVDGWKKLYGEHHPQYINSLLDLGYIQEDLGRPERSESYFRVALRIKSQEGKKDLLYSSAARALGRYYQRIGRYQRAEPLLKEAVAIRKAILGPKSYDYANSLIDLGKLYTDTQRLGLAKQVTLEIVSIQKSIFGEDSLNYATAQHNLGVVYHYLDEYSLAKESFQTALAIRQKRLGNEDRRCAYVLRSLGQLATTMRDYPRAEQLLQQASQIFEKRLGKKNTENTLTIRSLADVYAALNKWPSAFALHLENMEIEQERLRQVFSFSTEAGMFDYMATVQAHLETLLLLTHKQQEASPEVISASLTWTLRRKGIILEALSQLRQAEQTLKNDPNVSLRSQDLKMLRLKLAEYGVKGRPEDDDQFIALTARAEEVERILHTFISGYRRKQTQAFHSVDSEQVRDHLPAGAALVEFVRLRMRNFKPESNEPTWWPDHYMAFVLTADKSIPPRLFDLGPAEIIDKAIDAFRTKVKQAPRELRLSDEKSVEEDFRTVSSELYRLVFAPLRSALGKADLVHLAPDSELNRIPFQALIDEDGKYLIEKHRFAYLLTGRDLSRPAIKPIILPGKLATVKPLGKPAPVPARTVVFAGPDYDLKADGRASQVKNLLGKVSAGTELAMRGPTIDTRGLQWKPLPGAAAEADDVRNALQTARYRPVKTYVGPQALEEVIKVMPPPRILHIATHGFFLPEPKGKSAPQPDSTSDEQPEPARQGIARLSQMRNPLLRSGLVLAGANAIGENTTSIPVEDGWLTAEEIALLNLRGTELVVLSACETGLGDLRTGQGVYGLRHAFLYAGARSLVTSLFEVPDVQTRDIMKRFYESLNSGQDKLNALHQSQLQMIRLRREQHEAAHPFFWASFVLVGDPK